MTKMNTFLGVIGDKIEAFSGITRVYNERAPKNTEYPYIIYNIVNSDPDFQRQDFVLEVDVWGNNSNTTQIENLTDLIDGDGDLNPTNPSGFNRFKYFSSGVLQFNAYRMSRLTLPDSDEKIRRRQLRYEIKTYF